MAYVLCTGIDPALMATRKLLLEHAGHTVFAAQNGQDILAACGQICFDVAVIGQAASSAKKRATAALIRENCVGIKILELVPPHQGKVLEDADAWLEVPADVPFDLAERVNELVKKRAKKQA